MKTATLRPEFSSQSGTRLAILLLEDNVADAHLIADQLEEAGLAFELTRVESHEGFTRALSDCRFDLILSDFRVPGFEGTDALAAARLACPQTPFVFVTGALGEERAIELLKRGATDYVLKNRLERLLPSVERALREAREKAERKRTEEALRQSEERYRLATRATKDAIWDWNLRTDEVAWSEGLQELFAYRERDIQSTAQWWGELIHPEDRERILTAIHAIIDGCGKDWHGEYRFRRGDGSYAHVTDRGFVVRDEEGKPLRMVGAMQDVSDRKHQEEEARRRSEFEQQLIGIVSHDLRNPLNAILLAVSAILRREELDERVVKSLVRIQSSGDRAARMIRDLLDFTQARLGGGIRIERKPVSLKELVQQVVEEAEATHPGRDIRMHFEGESVGEWDPDRLSQAVGNLVANALRYSSEGSTISTSLRGEEDAVLFEVHNVGEPIAPDLRARLFQPMQQGDPAPERGSRSVGLGLYIVDHIVRGHHGSVDVQSSAEEGTTFRLRLPRRAPNSVR